MTDEAAREAWVTLPSEEDVLQARPELKRSPYYFGFIPAMSRLIGAHDKIGPAFGALFAQVMFAPGHLSRREREMVAAVAAAAQDCHY